MKSVVKYGQVIRIHHSQGIIVAKGFTDPNAYFLKIESLELANNYRDSLFQVLPRGTFELHDEYLKYYSDSLSNRVQTEASQYYVIIQSRMDEEILFGAEVVFKHLDSQQYLYGSYECSEVAMDAFKLKLSQKLSSQTIFKLAPHQTYQKEGQIIYLGEPMLIVHEKSQCKLDFQDCNIFLDYKVENEEPELHNEQYNPTIKKPLHGRAEAVISLNSRSQWTLLTHEQKGKIASYDMCFFVSTQNQGYLCTDGFKLTLKEFSDREHVPLEAVWELQQCDHKFVVRNRMTGKVINSKSQMVTYTGKDEEHLSILPAKLGMEELAYNIFVKIKHNQLELQKLQVSQCFRRLSSISPQIDQYYKQLSQEDLQYIQCDVGFAGDSMHGFQIARISDTHKHDLLLITSSHEILQQFSDTLRLGISKIERIINDKVLAQVLKVIQKLIAYLLNCEYEQIDHCDSLPIYQRQLYMKDLLIVEIIMQIIYFTWVKNESDRLFEHRKYERDKMRQIYKYSYMLIEKMTKNNPSVKLYISQWLKLFLIQAIGIDDEQIQTSLFELLDDNYYSINKFIQEETLLNLVELISTKKELHEKYLRIFSSIIICNGKPIIQNQIAILDMFYKSKGRKKAFYKFEFQCMDGVIVVQSSYQKWQSLRQFYLESFETDNLQSWNYFLAYINLLSDICQNRNKFGKEYVSENYQLSILCSILEDPETNEVNAIEPFLKLIHTAFIDCQSFSPIRRIARVREWAIIEKKRDIIKTKAKIEGELIRVMKFITKFIDEFEYFQVKRKQYNKNLFTVLQVLKTTIRLGFWQTITELQQLLPNLFKIVSCVRDITEYEFDDKQNMKYSTDFLQAKRELGSLFNLSMEKLTKINSENIIIMKCKQLACEIIDIIIDMETNVRVSLSTIKIKELIESGDPLNVTEWKSFFQELIENRNLFKCFSNNIEVRFAELTYFESEALQTYAIKLLNRVYGQRRELIYNFDKTIIVNKGFTHTLSELSRLTRTKLLSFNDRNILEASLDNQGQYNAFLWKESKNNKETGVIQDLCWLVECLKQGDEILISNTQINYDSLCPKNRLHQVYTERESNFRLHQSLLKSQDLHENILIFIQIATDCENKPLIMKTLYSCYQYLTSLVWNHQENKIDFCSSIEIYYPHIQYNLYCAQFLRELFQNNKILLFNEFKCSKTIDEVVKCCNDLPYDKYYKSQLLDFLRVLTIYNNKSVKVNQNLIMASLQDRKHTNVMLLFNHPDSLLLQLESLIEEYQYQYSKTFKQKVQNVKINPKLTYLFNYFQLLTLLISDQNEINIGKCKQMHPHHKLIALYQQTAQCWPLKRYLRAYINRLYYCSSQFIGITQNLIEIDIENILSDLRDIIDLKESDHEYERIKISNPTRYTYLCSYIYLTLEENLVALHSILNQRSFVDELGDTLQFDYNQLKFKLHLELIEIGSLLQQVQRLWCESEFIVDFTNILMFVFCSIYKSFDISMLILRNTLWNSFQMKKISITTAISQKKYSNGKIIHESSKSTSHQVDPREMLQQRVIQLTEDSRAMDNPKIVDKLKDQLIQEICDYANIKNSIIYNAGKQYVKSNRKLRRQSSQTEINEELNSNHRQLMTKLSEDQSINQFLEDEFNKVCQELQGLDEQGQKLYQTIIPLITLKDFIQNIIHLNLNHYETLSEDLKIFFLKVLERTITGKNEQNNKAIDQWDPEDWCNQKKEIEEAQNFLEGCGAAELICKFLRIPGLELRLGLTNQLISFGIAFLLGGNTQPQNSILEKFMQDGSNLMLINYRQLIKRVSRAVYNNFRFRKNKKFYESEFNVNLYDNFDYYDDTLKMMTRANAIEQDDAKETQIKWQFVQLFNRSFRFLQLLCENNNISMKNFIRQQIDTDNNPKIGTINFIELATSQLRIFCKAFNKNIINTPIYILDFIVEVVQVPCLDNQITLCKTTFFEDVCYLVQYLSLEENLKDRNLEDMESQQKLQVIYNKILIAIMSVLEGNDDRIFDDLQNKIDPKFLIEIINQYLNALGVTNCEQMQEKLQQQQLQYSDEIVKILNVLIIKEKISSQKIKFYQEDPQKQQIMDLLHTKILKIEIIYQNKPQTILFPSHPLFTFLSDQTRDMIMYRVNRDTWREKILGLLEYKNLIHNELEYNYKLSKKYISITSKQIQRLRQLSAFFSILVNILMVITYNMEIQNFQVLLIADFHEQIIINMLAFCQLFTTIVYYIFYLIYRIPLCIKEESKNEEPEIIETNNTSFKRRMGLLGDDEIHITGSHLMSQSFKFRAAFYLVHLFQWLSGEVGTLKPKLHKFYMKCCYIVKQVQNVINNEDDFLQITSYLFFALLGTFYKSYFFSLHLFDLFSRLTLLNNVFQAISHNAKQLIVVSLLGVLFIYVFSFTSFDQYADDIYTEKSPEEHCETLISCMITLVTSGVIGTSMSKWDFVKFCYDTLYFVFFALLFTNIISGIMIDTFAELRDQRQKIDDDKKNCCYICGVKRVQLEKNSEIFEEHIKDKHFLWNYIYYMYCLMKKDSTEYTGLEYSISEMIEQENITWFPLQIEQEINQEDRLSKLESQIHERLTLLSQEQQELSHICERIFDNQYKK